MALLKVAGVAKSTYFYHISNMDKVNELEEEIKSQILSIFSENKGRYGYRRITLELKNRGFNVNHKKIQRIMKELEKDIIEYIEYYNNRRIKSKLKGMTPVQYRIHSLQVA